jgi:hypothetical protein
VTHSEALDLPHIEALIGDEGQITLGAMSPVGDVAIASNAHGSLAMLSRRPGWSLTELLLRLDTAVQPANEHDVFADGINARQTPVRLPCICGRCTASAERYRFRSRQ